MPAFFTTLAPRRTRLIAVAGALLAGLALGFLRPHLHRANPLLETPALVLEGLQAKALYYNAAARPWLLARRPDLLTAEDRGDHPERARAFAQAVLVPRFFRQLDRREPARPGRTARPGCSGGLATIQPEDVSVHQPLVRRRV